VAPLPERIGPPSMMRVKSGVRSGFEVLGDLDGLIQQALMLGRRRLLRQRAAQASVFTEAPFAQLPLKRLVELVEDGILCFAVGSQIGQIDIAQPVLRNRVIPSSIAEAIRMGTRMRSKRVYAHLAPRSRTNSPT